MKFTNEHIQQLLIEKITGAISPVDDLAIEQLLIENEEVSLQWKALQLQLQLAKAQGFSVEADIEKNWQEILPLMAKPAKARVFSVPKIAIAAVLLSVILSCVYLSGKKESSPLLAAKLPSIDSENEITLSIDNGEAINLARSGSNTYHLGAATIITNESELRYISPKIDPQSWTTLTVPAIADYKIVLADGTEVWLNSKTKLKFPLSFTGETREVEVDGEAYFKVTKNKHQPFIVHAGETWVKVFGTEFNVNTYEGNTIKTALVEGAVSVASNKRQVSLTPGYAAVSGSNQTAVRVEAFDESEVLSWIKGVYYFHNMRLKDLSKLLSRWYNVTVRFENPAVGNKTFSGMVKKNQPIQLFLDNIKISYQMNSVLQDGVVYFK